GHLLGWNGQRIMIPIRNREGEIAFFKLGKDPQTTSTPIERAVPFTEFIADSSVKLFRSGILILAISSTCFSVILPTRFLFGSAEPFASPQARLMSTGTGGVLVMNVNDRSEKMVMTTGMIRPSWSLADVLALNALQNSMMLTPCGPSAVPTG